MIKTPDEYQVQKDKLYKIESRLNEIAKEENINLKEVVSLREEALEIIKKLNSFINSITKKENK